jgi:hypothetical protein
MARCPAEPYALPPSRRFAAGDADVDHHHMYLIE